MNEASRAASDRLAQALSLGARLRYALDTDLLLGYRVVRELRGCARLLEVGAGPPGLSWSRLLGREALELGVGLDAFRPYLAHVPHAVVRWGQYVIGSAERLPFADGSFDGVFALDVVEHLDKASGWRMIAEMKRVARSTVVLVTPNGFLPQSADENPYQAHRSGWSVEELRGAGFRVRGIRGVRGLRTERAALVLRPTPWGYAMSTLTAPLAAVWPKGAFALCATFRKS